MAATWKLWTFKGEPGQDVDDWATLCRLKAVTIAREFDDEQDKSAVKIYQLKQGLGGKAWEWFRQQPKEDKKNFDLILRRLSEEFTDCTIQESQLFTLAMEYFTQLTQLQGENVDRYLARARQLHTTFLELNKSDMEEALIFKMLVGLREEETAQQVKIYMTIYRPVPGESKFDIVVKMITEIEDYVEPQGAPNMYQQHLSAEDMRVRREEERYTRLAGMIAKNISEMMTKGLGWVVNDQSNKSND